MWATISLEPVRDRTGQCLHILLSWMTKLEVLHSSWYTLSMCLVRLDSIVSIDPIETSSCILTHNAEQNVRLFSVPVVLIDGEDRYHCEVVVIAIKHVLPIYHCARLEQTSRSRTLRQPLLYRQALSFYKLVFGSLGHFSGCTVVDAIQICAALVDIDLLRRT